MSIRPFHLAIPVHNLEQAREFYGQVLGFNEVAPVIIGLIMTVMAISWWYI